MKVIDLSEINWPDVWKSELNLNWQCQANRNLSDYWLSKEQALIFWKKTQEQKSFYSPILSRILIREGETVLDIGGGPGTIALPLAERGAHVTVVEPAIGMVSVLSDNIKDQGISNIEIIHSRWEEVLPEQLKSYDHIIACFSLGMPDIQSSLEKMITVSAGNIYLIWFSGLNSWDQMMKSICTGACGMHYHESPKTNLLYLVLNNMGIYPDITHIRQPFFEKFESFDTAVVEIEQRCGHSYPGKNEFIKKWVLQNLTFLDGIYIWNPSITMSIISWKSEGRKGTG